MQKTEILERIISHYALKNKTGLASFLGVSAQTVSNWYSRNSIDFDLVFEKCSGVDLNWLILGRSFDYNKVIHTPSVASDCSGSYEVPVLRNKVIPVLSDSGYMNSDLKYDDKKTSCETITIPDYMLGDGDYIAFKVTDEAMSPSFFSGNHLVCKRIVDLLQWRPNIDKSFIFAVSGQKLLFRRPVSVKNDAKKIILSADNPDKSLFPDIEISVRDINDLWEVELALTPPNQTGSEVIFRRLKEIEKDLEGLKRAFNATSV